MRMIAIGVVGGLAILGALAFQQTKMANKGPGWVGQPAKSAVLKSSDGKAVDLSKYYGKQPVVLVFYRGVWCPFCQAQLRELGKHESDFKKANVRFFLISSEDAATQNDMRRTTGVGSYFTFLSDPGAKLAAAYGGKNAAGYLDAATVVIGKSGKVTFGDANPNYQQRPTPEQILAATRR